MQQRVQALRSSVRRNEHKKVNDTKVRFWNNSGFDENSDTVAIYSVEDWRMLTKEELILLLKFCCGLWRNSIVKPDQGIRSQVGPLLPRWSPPGWWQDECSVSHKKQKLVPDPGFPDHSVHIFTNVQTDRALLKLQPTLKYTVLCPCWTWWAHPPLFITLLEVCSWIFKNHET